MIKKVVNTYKDGVLTSSKETAVSPATNPDTGRLQRTPEHHKVLDLADFSSLSLRQAAKAQEDLFKEIRLLRRKLVQEQRAVKARTKERDALKRALQSKRDQVAGLKEHSENLAAQVSGLEDDNRHLEEELSKSRRSPSPINSRPYTAPSVKSSATPEAATGEDNVRFIAAKPIKK
jgi:chromosome segregation ATPase